MDSHQEKRLTKIRKTTKMIEPLFNKKRVWYGQDELIESDTKSTNVGFRVGDVIQAVEDLKKEINMHKKDASKFYEGLESKNIEIITVLELINNVFYGIKEIEEKKK